MNNHIECYVLVLANSVSKLIWFYQERKKPSEEIIAKYLSIKEKAK
jgi:hypothetical protein